MATTTTTMTWTVTREGDPYQVGELIANPGRWIGSTRYCAKLATPWVVTISYGPFATAAIRQWERARDAAAEEGQRVAERLGIAWQLREWWEVRSTAMRQPDERFARLEALEAAASAALAAIKDADRQDRASFDALADDDGPERLVVVSATRRWIAEDGESLGLSTWSGYLYSAAVRAAEAQP